MIADKIMKTRKIENLNILERVIKLAFHNNRSYEKIFGSKP